MDGSRVEDRFFDALQNLEFAINSVYRTHPELADSNVDRVLEALVRQYKAEASQRTAPPARLSPLEQELLAQVQTMAEFRLGRSRRPPQIKGPNPAPINTEDMIEYLKRIRRSVRFWTNERGRQGYMNYVDEFIE